VTRSAGASPPCSRRLHSLARSLVCSMHLIAVATPHANGGCMFVCAQHPQGDGHRRRIWLLRVRDPSLASPPQLAACRAIRYVVYVTTARSYTSPQIRRMSYTCDAYAGAGAGARSGRKPATTRSSHARRSALQVIYTLAPSLRGRLFWVLQTVLSRRK
jgi:hypothetical protein